MKIVTNSLFHLLDHREAWISPSCIYIIIGHHIVQLVPDLDLYCSPAIISSIALNIPIMPKYTLC